MESGKLFTFIVLSLYCHIHSFTNVSCSHVAIPTTAPLTSAASYHNIVTVISMANMQHMCFLSPSTDRYKSALSSLRAELRSPRMRLLGRWLRGAVDPRRHTTLRHVRF